MASFNRGTESLAVKLTEFLKQISPARMAQIERGDRILCPCHCSETGECCGWVAIDPDEVEAHMRGYGRAPHHVPDSTVRESL